MAFRRRQEEPVVPTPEPINEPPVEPKPEGEQVHEDAYVSPSYAEAEKGKTVVFPIPQEEQGPAAETDE